MAGQFRTFVAAAPSFKANVLDALQPDLFAHLSTAWTAPGWRGQQSPPPILAPHRAEKLFRGLAQPVYLRVEANTTHSREVFVTLFGAIQERERQRGASYQWLLRLRPDLVFSCKYELPFLVELASHPLFDNDFLCTPLPAPDALSTCDR